MFAREGSEATFVALLLHSGLRLSVDGVALRRIREGFSVAVMRGTASGLEFLFGGGEAFNETAAAIYRRLADRPEFYSGGEATVVFDGYPPDADAFTAFLATMRTLGIRVRGVYGPGEFAAFAKHHEIPYLGVPVHHLPVANLEDKREARAVRVLRLSEEARSLDADFAAARTDFALRRKKQETPAEQNVVPASGALYHRGTLRGGQVLQHVGNIVVIGDVNPGASLVAGGDVVVLGALLGTAHAGAQGNASARVIAVKLTPTQLRIATSIAVDDTGRRPSEPEVAYVEGQRIVIAPLGAGS